MTLRCDVEPLLRSYVDDELSATESARVEAHVGQCPHCAERLQREAMMCAQMFALAEAVELEPETTTRTPKRRWRWPRLAWPSAFVSAALVFTVCDRAAMSDALDGATVVPGQTRAVAGTAGPDETRPPCEEPTWLGPEALAEGPTCSDPVAFPVTLALASFPPAEPDPEDWDLGEPVCHPDDGGDLACIP